MKITRIIALAIIAGASGTAGIQAQTLRETRPPAEYPPASYKGKQYVDSRGCIYIRAGIDGNVSWVPRVTRSRKQICGYAPTQVAGATRQPQTASGPELITLEPSQQPAQTAAAETAAARPAAAPAQPAAASAPPAAVTTAKPRRTAKTTSVQPAAAAAAPAAAKPVAKPVVKAAPEPAPQPVPAAQPQAGCAGLSDISRQYTNSSGVRCGPQDEGPVTYGGQGGIGPQSSVRLTPNTRIVQTHVYQDRRLSNSFTVPDGYRPVWTDGRLNPQRAERTVRPAVVTSFSQAPAGYQVVERDDGRMNPMRGVRTPEGDAQMARIWTDGVPRDLVQLPLDRPAVRLPRNARVSPAEAQPKGLRLSTRSAPGAAGPDQLATAARYVRAATYADPAEAKAAARRLASSGLTVRLGTVSRNGQPYKVVLAGPYREHAQAAAALSKVQHAGFSGARLSK
ncbi:SPOR domain-containing protein [Leisingera daeponensis]|uniref:SPOR domain-containing protein n=1 Tax=Leisingera daeponensis TaxID=405746 RepID=A0ABS7NBY7_9RHOB|nr:SPOR domain-containing protein [Leisingera daeponensis]MBY6138715.1 SPOR domain-containing protein [Leisingera daeponensis]